MGYKTYSTGLGKKYLITRSREPYCIYPYLLELTIGNLEKRTVGEISLLYGNLKITMTKFLFYFNILTNILVEFINLIKD